MEMIALVSSYSPFKELSGSASFIFEKFCSLEQYAPQKYRPQHAAL